MLEIPQPYWHFLRSTIQPTHSVVVWIQNCKERTTGLTFISQAWPLYCRAVGRSKNVGGREEISQGLLWEMVFLLFLPKSGEGGLSIAPLVPKFQRPWIVRESLTRIFIYVRWCQIDDFVFQTILNFEN